MEPARRSLFPAHERSQATDLKARWSGSLPQDGRGTRFSASIPTWKPRTPRPVLRRLAGRGSRSSAAADVEILTWANEHRFVVITNDLDFSAILAAGAVDGPSVVQLRTQDLLSESAARIVARDSKRIVRTSIEAHSCRLTKAGRA